MKYSFTSSDKSESKRNSWSNYQTVRVTTLKSLTAGPRILRITITGANCDIDKITLRATGTGVDDIEEDAITLDGPAYNIAGQKVGNGYRGIVIRNGKKYNAKQ